MVQMNVGADANSATSNAQNWAEEHGITTPSAPSGGASSIYMGGKNPGMSLAGESNTGPVPNYSYDPGNFMNVEQASAQFWKLTPEEKLNLSDIMLADTGYRPKTLGSQKAYWESLVKLTGEYQSATGTAKWSPWDMGGLVAQTSTTPPGGGGGSGPSTNIYETSQANLSNPSTARGILDSAIGQYLGRPPDQKEYSKFLDTLNGFQTDNPTVQKQIVKNSGGQNATIVTDGKTTGGVDARQVAKEFAMNDDQYAETTVSTTGVDAFLELLR